MADGHYDGIRDRSGPPLLRSRLAIGLAVVAGLLATAPAAADASLSRGRLEHGLAKQMRHVGGAGGAFVTDLGARRNSTLFGWSSHRRRPLASNTKLFTMAALLDRFGPGATFKTRVYERGERGAGRHTLHGSVVVVGAGDPALGKGSFARRFGVPLTPLGGLAGEIRRAGIKRIRGQVRVDDSIFDRRRGIPTSGVDASGELGPLSGLSYDSGIVHGHYAGNPEIVAARALKGKLRRIGVRVEGGIGRADLPARVLRKRPLGSVSSPSVASLVTATLRPSNNFFAEMLLKRLAAGRAGPRGTTRRGVHKVRKFARRIGTRVEMENGSGLSRSDRASPRQVVRLLAAMSRRRGAGAYRRALPLAGEQGTVADRMNGTAADGRCRTKTCTPTAVSALSGYCKAGHGTVAFSILMGTANLDAARHAQDKMAALIARYRR
jgi:serine-type D-Ala-D-Ala carboxypeptidase/endopeptidase (penicillin-binding protein 4)